MIRTKKELKEYLENELRNTHSLADKLAIYSILRDGGMI